MLTPWNRECQLPPGHSGNCDTNIDRTLLEYRDWAVSPLAAQRYQEYRKVADSAPAFAYEFDDWVQISLNAWECFVNDMYVMAEYEDLQEQALPEEPEDFSWADEMAVNMVTEIRVDQHEPPVSTVHADHVFRYEVLDDADEDMTLVVHITPEGIICDLTDSETGEVVATFAATAQEVADDLCH